MAVNYGTYGTYVKTDNTGTMEYRYVYNADAVAMSNNCVVILAPSAAAATYTRADGTTYSVYSVDHAYLTTSIEDTNIAGVVIQKIPAGSCGWIQTKGFNEAVNLCGDGNAWAAGLTLGTASAEMYGGKGTGLGRLAEAWTSSASTGKETAKVFIDTGTKPHYHENLSATNVLAENVIASVVVSAYSTADLYVDDDTFLADDVLIGGDLTCSAGDAWLSSHVGVTDTISGAANILGGKLDVGSADVAGRIDCGGAISGTDVQGTGNLNMTTSANIGTNLVVGGYGDFTGAVSGTDFQGTGNLDITTSADIATGPLTVTTTTIGANISATDMDASGYLQAGSAHLGNIVTTGYIDATGAISGTDFQGTGNLDIGVSGDIATGPLTVATTTIGANISCTDLDGSGYLQVGSADIAGSVDVANNVSAAQFFAEGSGTTIANTLEVIYNIAAPISDATTLPAVPWIDTGGTPKPAFNADADGDLWLTFRANKVCYMVPAWSCSAAPT